MRPNHTHTCIDCSSAIPCRGADWLDCTGDDGDGRCAVCGEREFDRIGAYEVKNAP
jgi:hypothetical protein